MTSQKIQIQIVIDLVCPWCFIGKRRLDKAITAYQNKNKETPVEFEIQWLPYQLVPNAPKLSVPKYVNYAERFGEQRSKQMIAHMIETGKSEGIAFNYSGNIGNTLDAHRLIYYAQQHSKGNEVVEALFHNYFELTRDIADNDTLIEIATSIGLDKDKVSQFINSSEGVQEVKHLLKNNRPQSGVPDFLIQNKYHFSGARDPEIITGIFERSLNN